MTLLNKRFAPIVFRIGFLNCSFSKVQDTFVRWKRQHCQSLESTELSLPLEDTFRRLEPLTAIPNKWLLTATTNDWVAYFDNGIRGPDPVSAISYLANSLQCRGVIATSIPHTLEEEFGVAEGFYGAVQFELFSPHKTSFLNYERTISVAYEAGRWRFDADGSIQSFEDVEMYKKLQIRERFTPQMLGDYCRALNIEISSTDFYRSQSVLVSCSDPLPKESVGGTIEQVQQKIGFSSFRDS